MKYVFGLVQLTTYKVLSIPVSLELGSLVAGVVAVLGFIVYGKTKNRLIKPAAQAAIKGHELRTIINNYADENQCVVSSSYVNVHNGDSVPKFDAILKYDMIYSSDKELMQMFGGKSQLLDIIIHGLYSDCWLSGEGFIDSSQLIMPKQKIWAEQAGVGKIGMFFVKNEGGDTKCLFVNFKKDAKDIGDAKKKAYLLINQIQNLPKKKIRT